MKESMENSSWCQDSSHRDAQTDRVRERRCRYAEDISIPWAAELCTRWMGWPCFPALDKRKDKPVGMQWQWCSQHRQPHGKSRKPFLHSEQQPVRERVFFNLIWLMNRDCSVFSCHKYPAIIWVCSSFNKVWLIWTSMGKSPNKTSPPINCTFENKLQWVLRLMRETDHIPHQGQSLPTQGCCYSSHHGPYYLLQIINLCFETPLWEGFPAQLPQGCCSRRSLGVKTLLIASLILFTASSWPYIFVLPSLIFLQN